MRRRLCVYTIMLIAGISAGYFVLEKLRLVSGCLFLLSLGLMCAFFFPREEKRKCLVFLVIGFSLLGGYYSYYESFDDVEEYGKYRVLSISDKGEYSRCILRDIDNRRRVTADIDNSLIISIDPIEMIGNIAEIDKKPKVLRSADNPGCFDYRLYMRSLGISSAYKAEGISIVDKGGEPIWVFRRHLLHCRELFIDCFDEETGGFLKGVIFGDKSEIDEEVLKEFNMNSSGHILAVSGLHIGFLYALLKLMSGNKKTWPASLMIISLLIIYGEMTLWNASTIRAVIVMSINLLSVNIRRKFDLLSSLAAAALVILMFRPYMLFNTGFQMSFAAMCSIALLGRRLAGICGKVLGAAFAVQIGTIPLIAMSFHRINLLAFAINIPIIMLSSVLVPISILGLMIYAFTGQLPALLVAIIELFCDSVIMVNHNFSFDGYYSELVPGVSALIVIIIYGAIALISSEWTRINLVRKDYNSISRFLALMLIPLVSAGFSLFDAFSDDEIVFIAVEQGDAVHIRSGNKDVLIDGGGSDYSNVGERILMPYLLSQGADNLDICFVTHLHMDHYKGITELGEEYPIRTLAIPSDYKDTRGGEDTTTERLVYIDGESDVVINEDLSIRAIWPLKRNQVSIAADDPNEHNMVYMINYKGVKIMVTGDLLADDEEKMLRHYRGGDALNCDILKVAHHGSKSSSTEEFLDATSPEIAVIQVGRNNLYGHPHAEILERLKERGIKVYRTDTDGAVGIDIYKNKRIKIHTMH